MRVSGPDRSPTDRSASPVPGGAPEPPQRTPPAANRSRSAAPGRAASGTPQAEDPVSLPLYISGLIVSLAGVTAINSQVSNPTFSFSIIFLTVLGFVFSWAYRWMRLDARYLHYLALVLAVGVAYGYFSGSLNIMALLPPGVELPPDLIMAVFLEWILVIRSWMLLSDGEVAFSSIFSVSIIGLVSVYEIDPTVITDFLVYIIASVFLLIHQNYLVQRSWSGPRERYRPEGRVLKAQALIAGVCGLVVLMLAAIVVTPIAAVGSHLSLGGAFRGLLMSYKGSDSKTNLDALQSEISFSDDPDFTIGGGSAADGADTTILLHVDSSDHQPRYWRGRAYDRYVGNAWISSLVDPVPTNPQENPAFTFGRRLRMPGVEFTLDSAAEPGGENALPPALRANSWSPLVTSVIEIKNGRTNTLYAPAYPHQVVVPLYRADTLTETEDGDITQDGVSEGYWYVVTSYGGEPSINALRSCRASNCPADMRPIYIDQFGDNVSTADREQLLQTAQRIVASLPASQRDEYDEASAIREWVSQQCIYTLSPPATPSGSDSVSYFLFNSRKGYCDLFASSMAILCRYAGIPARVVTGFDQGVESPMGGYDLRAMDKHAWVEVFFPGQGWYPFDPTEGTRTDSTVSDSQSQGSSAWKTLVAWVRSEMSVNGTLPVVLFVVVLISLAVIVKTELVDPALSRLSRRRKHRRLLLSENLSAEQVEQLWPSVKAVNASRYSHMERMMAQAGLPREASWTPSEYERFLGEKLPPLIAQRDLPDADEQARLAVAATKALTADFVLAHYAPPDAAAVQLLERERAHVGENALENLARITRRARLTTSLQRLLRKVLPARKGLPNAPATE